MTARVLPASVGQRLLWVLDRYRGATGALNCPMLCRVRGPLDAEALARALDTLAARHESLRTTFTHQRRQLCQVIAPRPPGAGLARADLADGDDPGAALAGALTAELATRIDPTARPSRATLWRLGREDHVLCLNLHHLVTDTWSCDVLFRELPAAYTRAAGGDAPLPPVAWQYAQYALWQRRQLERDRFGRQRDYWLRQLDDLRLAGIPLRPPCAAGRRDGVQDVIGAAAAAGLRDIARRHGTTVFAVALAVYYALIHRMNGQRDVTVASLVANRTRPEVQRTVGFLANLVLLRVRLPARPAFHDVVRHARTTVVDALANQEFPYHLLPQVAARGQGLRADDVVFQMLPDDLEVTIRAGATAFTGMAPDVVGRFELELALMPSGDVLRAKLYHSTERLDPGWARAFLTGYTRLASAVAADPSTPLDALMVQAG